MNIQTTEFDYSEMHDIDNSLVEAQEIEHTFSSIIDRGSSDYHKAQAHNNISRKVIDNSAKDPLTDALLDAKHLTNETKTKYIEQTQLLMLNMQDNIFRNQFKLAEEYPEFTADEWNAYLQDRIVSVYINRHKRTLLKIAAEDNLADPYAKNKRDNLNLINSIKEEEQQEAEKNVVIIRIPDIYED
jgi:hypothetical protein